jgi:hypothetical protein
VSKLFDERPAARDDVLMLIKLAVMVTCEKIEENGSFLPFGIVMNNDGEVGLEAPDISPGQDLPDYILTVWHSIQDKTKSLRAAIVVNQGGAKTLPILMIGGGHKDPKVPPFRAGVSLKWTSENRLVMDDMQMEPWPDVTLFGTRWSPDLPPRT